MRTSPARMNPILADRLSGPTVAASAQDRSFQDVSVVGKREEVIVNWGMLPRD